MRFNEFFKLFESAGLKNRRPGDVFVSDSNPEDKIYVSLIQFYPKPGTKFGSKEELNSALEEVKSKLETATINIIGNFKPSDLAFGLAVFTRPTSAGSSPEVIAFIKPFDVAPTPSQNRWSNQNGIPGYKFSSKSASKTTSGMLPQDILDPDRMDNLTAEDVVSQISKKFGDQHPLTTVARDIASGAKFPIKVQAPAGMNFQAFRDYFCELMHPIALQRGLYSGNAAAAAERYLGSKGYGSTRINFSNKKNEGLFDSILATDDGRNIKVSSKGEAGAEASVKNIVDVVNEIKNPTLMKKYKDTIGLVNKVAESGQYGAPILLGVEYNIIDTADVDHIKKFKSLGFVSFDSIDDLEVSDSLKTLLKSRVPKNKEQINLFFHAISAVAHKVSNHVNDRTNFGKAAAEILNNGALVQVHTHATEEKDHWVITDFLTKWPGDAVTGVKFSAQKNYSSGSIKGNFTFKILLNDAKDIPDEQEQLDKEISKPVNRPKKAKPETPRFGPQAVAARPNWKSKTDITSPLRSKR